MMERFNYNMTGITSFSLRCSDFILTKSVLLQTCTVGELLQKTALIGVVNFDLIIRSFNLTRHNYNLSTSRFYILCSRTKISLHHTLCTTLTSFYTRGGQTFQTKDQIWKKS